MTARPQVGQTDPQPSQRHTRNVIHLLEATVKRKLFSAIIAASTLAAAAVAAASEEASTNVQSVASATEEMASSVNEISRQVQESARMANEAVDQARETRKEAAAIRGRVDVGASGVDPPQDNVAGAVGGSGHNMLQERVAQLIGVRHERINPSSSVVCAGHVQSVPEAGRG